jgi:hypothetical protein
VKVYGLVLAYSFANGAFLLLKVKAALIDVGDKGNGLRKIDVDGFVRGQVLVVRIRDLDRAVLDTGSATRALVFYDVAGLLVQDDLEVSCRPFDTVNFSIGQDFYVGMPADLDQFGREYSHGAVVRGIGLVELGHVAADGRRFLDQIHLETRMGEIQRGLDAADPSADNHDIPEIAVSETFVHLIDLFFLHCCQPLCDARVPPQAAKSQPGGSP